MSPQDQMDELEKKAKQQHEAAMHVLATFIEQYTPAAARDDADTFFTTSEISNAIHSHTGVRLDNAEIFEMLNNMGYKYEALNGVEFNWVLKKEN